MIIINLFSLVAKISLEDKEFTRGVDNSEKSFSGFGKKVTGVIAGLGITKLAADTLKLGIDTNAMAETSGIAWETLLGSQEKSKKMLDDIASFAATTPFEKMGVDNMAKQLHNAGFEGQGLFDQLTKFGDIGGAFGVQAASLEEMVRQYSQVKQAGVAYTEDLNILQDRGIPIYKAIAEELGINTAEVKKWASEGKISADIYQAALDGIASSVEGGMAKQSKSFTGMVSTFKDGMAELAGILSKPVFDFMKKALEDIQPKLDKFIEVLGKEGIGAALESVIPGFSEFAKKAGLVASAIFGAVFALKAFALIQGIVGFVQAAITAFKLFAGAVKGATLAQTLLNIAMMLNPIGLIIGLVGALVGAFIYLWNTNEDFKNFWINAWELVKTTFLNVWNGIMDFFNTTIPGWIESIKNWFTGLPEYFLQLWESVKQTFTNWGNAITNFFTTTIPQWITNIGNWFNELPYKIGFALGNAIGKIIEWGAKTWDYLVTNVPKWIEGINQWFSELPGKIQTWLTDVINKVTQWGSEMLSKATTAASNFVNKVIEYMSQLPGKIKIWLTDAANKVVTWGIDMVNKGRTAASETMTAITTKFQELPGKMLDIGKNVVRGIWDGIMGMKDWISNKIGGFMSGIVDGAKSALGIHSPSRVFAKEVGSWIPPGISQGFEKSLPGLVNDMNVDLNSMVGQIKPKINSNISDSNGNNGTIINQTINTKAVLSPQEIAQETKNTFTRAKWKLA